MSNGTSDHMAGESRVRVEGVENRSFIHACGILEPFLPRLP